MWSLCAKLRRNRPTTWDNSSVLFPRVRSLAFIRAHCSFISMFHLSIAIVKILKVACHKTTANIINQLRIERVQKYDFQNFTRLLVIWSNNFGWFNFLRTFQNSVPKFLKIVVIKFHNWFCRNASFKLEQIQSSPFYHCAPVDRRLQWEDQAAEGYLASGQRQSQQHRPSQRSPCMAGRSVHGWGVHHRYSTIRGPGQPVVSGGTHSFGRQLLFYWLL